MPQVSRQHPDRLGMQTRETENSEETGTRQKEDRIQDRLYINDDTSEIIMQWHLRTLGLILARRIESKWWSEATFTLEGISCTEWKRRAVFLIQEGRRRAKDCTINEEGRKTELENPSTNGDLSTATIRLGIAGHSWGRWLTENEEKILSRKSSTNRTSMGREVTGSY